MPRYKHSNRNTTKGKLSKVPEKSAKTSCNISANTNSARLTNLIALNHFGNRLKLDYFCYEVTEKGIYYANALPHFIT